MSYAHHVKCFEASSLRTYCCLFLLNNVIIFIQYRLCLRWIGERRFVLSFSIGSDSSNRLLLSLLFPGYLNILSTFKIFTLMLIWVGLPLINMTSISPTLAFTHMWRCQLFHALFPVFWWRWPNHLQKSTQICCSY